ncbi:hypothetical protein EHS19_06545 [Bifidobacterium jacchi]|uniref:Uncharacterized protein n=2 Tax=Bifidobacterium jacchi TaxID=2490545 RepID=A0A5N5RHL7_9BIFI|nr:hypothetical protein EHS19_06545 [Bifidobacterium jacchi]
MPRVDGAAESQQTFSACESAFYAASAHHDTVFAAAAPLIERYFAARSAESEWLDVAAGCENRMQEGALRSAQAGIAAWRLVQRLDSADDDYPDPSSDAIDATALSALSTQSDRSNPSNQSQNVAAVAPKQLTTMSLAEDRAGFALELLAARGASGASLTLSDHHKTTAQQLISAAQKADHTVSDPRQKVYAIDQLIADPDSAIDPATGLHAPTTAIIEIDCAREELGAFADDSTATGTDGASGAAALGTVDPARRALALLAATRAKQAFALGYPSGDYALFR